MTCNTSASENTAYIKKKIIFLSILVNSSRLFRHGNNFDTHPSSSPLPLHLFQPITSFTPIVPLFFLSSYCSTTHPPPHSFAQYLFSIYHPYSPSHFSNLPYPSHILSIPPPTIINPPPFYLFVSSLLLLYLFPSTTSSSFFRNPSQTLTLISLLIPIITHPHHSPSSHPKPHNYYPLLFAVKAPATFSFTSFYSSTSFILPLPQSISPPSPPFVHPIYAHSTPPLFLLLFHLLLPHPLFL